MTLYVIIFLVAVCIGMAVSVYTFGTGSKRAKIFKEIYFSIEDIEGMGVLLQHRIQRKLSDLS